LDTSLALLGKALGFLKDFLMKVDVALSSRRFDDALNHGQW